MINSAKKVKMDIKIRREEVRDYDVVYLLVKRAFESAEMSDGNEQELVRVLRNSKAFIPELSLVAEMDGKIVGHILFTKAMVGDEVVLALAPLSVLPEYQGIGIGTALIKEGHRIAEDLGYSYSVVLGSETYYPRTGYLRANQYGIEPPFDVPSENFMAYKIMKDAPKIQGMMRYAKEFGIDI